MSGDSEAPERSNEWKESFMRKGAATGHLPGPHDKVYDLEDVVDDLPRKIHDLTDVVAEDEPLRTEHPQEVLVIDGRGYEQGPPPEEKVHELADLEEDKPLPEQPQGLPQEELRRIVVDTVERMAREMIPEIAEKVIREEIEKLKREAEEEII